MPARVGGAGTMMSSAFERGGQLGAGSANVIGTQHGQPDAQQPPWQTGAAPRSSSGAAEASSAVTRVCPVPSWAVGSAARRGATVEVEPATCALEACMLETCRWPIWAWAVVGTNWIATSTIAPQISAANPRRPLMTPIGPSNYGRTLSVPMREIDPSNRPAGISRTFRAQRSARPTTFISSSIFRRCSALLPDAIACSTQCPT